MGGGGGGGGGAGECLSRIIMMTLQASVRFLCLVNNYPTLEKCTNCPVCSIIDISMVSCMKQTVEHDIVASFAVSTPSFFSACCNRFFFTTCGKKAGSGDWERGYDIVG